MKIDNLAALLLRATNDQLNVQAYGPDGALATTPLSYSDGDAVTVLVEALNDVDLYRITDRAEAWDRLAEAGVQAHTGRARDAWLDVVRTGSLTSFAADPTELSTIASTNDVGRAVWNVASAAIRVEQLRWLAADRPREQFARWVVTRLEAVAGTRWDLRVSPRLVLRSGRERQITAAVKGANGTAWVQAVSRTKDVSGSVAQVYYNFDRSTVQRVSRVSALAGVAGQWDGSFVEDLRAVGQVAFFEERDQLEQVVAGIVGEPTQQPVVDAAVANG